MTIVINMDTYRKHTLANPGYLNALARRSDSDCVRRPHLDAVLRARRDRDAHATQAADAPTGAANVEARTQLLHPGAAYVPAPPSPEDVAREARAICRINDVAGQASGWLILFAVVGSIVAAALIVGIGR